MAYSRRKSKAEELMIEVLKEYKDGMSLFGIVQEILQKDPECLVGKTPINSLYSIVYRKEKRRVENGELPLFEKVVFHRETLYKLYGGKKKK